MAYNEALTPTLAQVIMMGVDARLFDTHTCLPGVVESFDSAKNTVDVKPALKRKYEKETVSVEMPIINRVPVVYPRGSNWSLTGPMKKGDAVILVFSERPIDIWKGQGGVVDPDDTRRFNLSDAFAIPGGYPTSKPVSTISTTHLRLESGSARVELQDDGKFRIEAGGKEFLSIMIDTLTQLIAAMQALNMATTNTINGPTQLNNFAQYGNIKTQLETLKSDLTGIRG